MGVGEQEKQGVLEGQRLSWALTVDRICMDCPRREGYRQEQIIRIRHFKWQAIN